MKLVRYNSKKGRTEGNTVYKKIFRFDPDANCGYADAKIQVKEVLKEMDAPIAVKADKKGNYGVAAKCEELRAKLGGLFIERIQTMNINKEMSEDQLNDRLRASFPTKKDWLEGQLATMEDMYPDDDTTVNLAKLIKEVNKKIIEEENKKMHDHLDKQIQSARKAGM